MKLSKKGHYSYLNSDWSDQTLDLGSLCPGFLSVNLREGSVDNVLSDVIFLGKVKQLSDLAHPLGSQATRCGGVGKSGDLSLSLLYNHKVEYTGEGEC